MVLPFPVELFVNLTVSPRQKEGFTENDEVGVGRTVM
jgi:hypothetical protein